MNVSYYFILAGHTNEISRAFRSRGMLQENWLLISVAIVIGIVWGVLYFWEKFQLQRKSAADTPHGLFYDLCKSHRLSRTDTSCLLKAASENNADQPAMVFIDPTILDTFQKNAGTDLKYYKTLAEKLFGNT